MTVSKALQYAAAAEVGALVTDFAIRKFPALYAYADGSNDQDVWVRRALITAGGAVAIYFAGKYLVKG